MTRVAQAPCGATTGSSRAEWLLAAQTISQGNTFMVMNRKPLESGAPSDDPRAFRRCLGQYATGVAVMTACDGSQLAGMSANSFAALSLDPPLVLWSIRRNSASLPVFQRATHYAVNVLGADQAAVSMRFASPEPDKFESVAWTGGLGKAPLLENCLAHFECRLHQVIEGGDHLILVGLVERFTRFEGKPLLFSQGGYALPQEFLDSIEATPSVIGSDPKGLPFRMEDASLMRIANYASQRLNARFEEFQEHKEFSRSAFRMLAWLRHEPRSVADLVSLTYMGQREVQEGLHALVTRHLLVQDEQDRFCLTPSGLDFAQAMAGQVTEFERSVLEQLPAEDVRQIRHCLVTLACLMNAAV